MGQMIYKILTADQLATVEAGGLMQAPVDIADGYVHFSTSKQVQETLAKWFRGQKDCVLVSVDGEDFGPDLRWEKSRGGDFFPHVYAEVREHNISSIWPLDEFDADGAPLAPDDVTKSPEPSSKPGHSARASSTSPPAPSASCLPKARIVSP
jgi:uncharacterized protein (DUF952 family)